MANPTTNFGWQMPTATDLVTDLPADFEVFGQAVDTDFVGLKGGTTGQVLAKASGTDLDFVWSADAAGMTNPMTTTGDVIYSSSGSTPARLGIGTTGQVLTVAGGIPSWASAGSAFAGVSLYKSAAQSFSTGSGTNVTFDTELFDTDGFHSTATNTDRITIPAGKGGYYLLTARGIWTASSTGQRISTIRKNAGATQLARYVINNQTASAEATVLVQTVANLVATDFVVFECYQDGTGSLDLIGGGQQYSSFSAYYLGA